MAMEKKINAYYVLFVTGRRVTRVSHFGCQKNEKSEKGGVKITTFKPGKGM